MTRLRVSLSCGAAAVSLVLAAAPAEALTLVTYVSNWTGSNGNTCHSPAAACLSIGGALAKTEPGGEIRCLDNHQDGLFTIGKPITIDCGAPGSVIVGHSGFPAITVDLDEATYPNGVVTLRNLNIDAFPGGGVVTPGPDGIRVIGGGAAVHVENVTIIGFAEQGIDFAPSSSVDLFVRDTIISNNVLGGIFINPATAALSRASLSTVRLDGNGSFGLAVSKGSGATAAAVLDHVEATRNGGVGVQANGASALIHLNNSVVTGNTTGIRALNGGQIVSYQTNAIRLNNTNGVPTSVISLQ